MFKSSWENSSFSHLLFLCYLKRGPHTKKSEIKGMSASRQILIVRFSRFECGRCIAVFLRHLGMELVVSVPLCSPLVPYLSKAEILADLASFSSPLEFLLLKAAVIPSFKIEN